MTETCSSIQLSKGQMFEFGKRSRITCSSERSRINVGNGREVEDWLRLLQREKCFFGDKRTGEHDVRRCTLGRLPAAR